MAGLIRNRSSGTRQLGEPLDPNLGSDWLSNLPRFNQAERGSAAADPNMQTKPMVPGTMDRNEMLAEPPEGEGEGEGEPPNVTPQEQRLYDDFVGNGLKVIFDEKRTPVFVQRLATSENPVEGLASSTAMVVDHLAQHAQRSGVEIPPEILYHGGLDLMGSIAELSAAAGVHTFTEQEKEQALYMGLDLYGTLQEKRGNVDKQSIEQGYRQLIEANAQNRLDEVLPGISQAARKEQA